MAMLRVAKGFALALLGVSGVLELQVADPAPLSPDESYLAPFLDRLAQIRDSPIGRRYIFIAELVDVLPSWLKDWFVPLFLPHSTLTIPINAEIPIKIPGPIPFPGHITISSASLTNLNEFTTLKPAQMVKDSKFTWASHIALKQTTITLNAGMTLLGHEVAVTVTIPAKLLSVEASVVVAFEAQRLCEVWGKTMRSSPQCALAPFFHDAQAGASGLHITSLRLGLDDFDFALQVTGLGPELNKEVEAALDQAMREAKAEILKELPLAISEGVKDIGNKEVADWLEAAHQRGVCPVSTLPVDAGFEGVVNASRVCVVNNAAFALKWSNANCAAHTVSPQTDAYPVDVYRCADVRQMFPDAVPGQIMRVQSQAVAGVHEILDPAFRYVPESNAVSFECSGSTLLYGCDLLAVSPVDPAKLPQVQTICVINHAGFVMYFDAQDKRTSKWAGRSGTYPINQRQCRDLSATSDAQEGDAFEVVVKAIAGLTKSADRQVEYRKNGQTAAFQCRGTTLNYSCKLVVGNDAENSVPDENSTILSFV